MDPFEHFEHLDQLPTALRAEAVHVWAANPTASIAGLVIENGTDLHPDIASQFHDPIPAGREGACAIVPADFARLVVDRHGGPEAVEYLRGLDAAEKGSLLVVVLTPSGLRFGHVRIWVPTPDDPREGGPDFGEFTITMSRNDELKLLRQAVERAKENPAGSDEYFQRVVAKEQRPDGGIFERIKLYWVSLRSGRIVVTESSAGMTYARQTMDVDSIG